MQYEIRKSAVEMSEPEAGKLYRDSDGDLFMYLGSGLDEPWLEYKYYGIHRRVDDYPNGPLLELSVDEWADALTEKLRG